MAVSAAAPFFLILSRRRIGSLLIVLGVLLVVAGALLPMNSLPVNGANQAFQLPKLPGTSTLSLPIGSGASLALPTAGNSTAFDLIRHAFDHSLLTSGVGSVVVDFALRGGSILIGLAAIAAIATNVIPLMRGFAGIAAGLGLMGTSIVGGVVLGEHMRTLDLCSGSACTVNLHAGIWIMTLGFAAILVGGAIGALRPLAGLFSGVMLGMMGVGIGAGLAYLVASQHVLDVISQSTMTLPRILSP